MTNAFKFLFSNFVKLLKRVRNNLLQLPNINDQFKLPLVFRLLGTTNTKLKLNFQRAWVKNLVNFEGLLPESIGRTPSRASQLIPYAHSRRATNGETSYCIQSSEICIDTRHRQSQGRVCSSFGQSA